MFRFFFLSTPYISFLFYFDIPFLTEVQLLGFLLRYKQHPIKCLHLKSTIWWGLTSIYTHETITTIKIMNNYITSKSFFMPLCNLSLPALPHLPQTVTPRLASIFCRILYKQNHTVCTLFLAWILSLSIIIYEVYPYLLWVSIVLFLIITR